ncbi:hypothetical protein Lser_V15G40716 [Lactuca serriola]
MGNPMNFGLLLIFIYVFLVATTYTCFGVGDMSVFCSQQEKLALLNFKHHVKDPSGMLSSWVGNDCCLWEGIQCDNLTRTVESLHLRGGFLVGNEVNSCLAQLRNLKYLDLSGNDFRGSRIPKFIGSFKLLSYLNLSHSGFQGIIPSHLGNLSNLKVLDLSVNEELMSDDMAWTLGLLSLEHFVLSLVDLGGAQNWDILYTNPLLKELNLWGCKLSNTDLGPFLNSTGILPSIKYLDLGFNYFIGPLPGFLQNLTSLTFLDLSHFYPSLAWNFGNLLNTNPSLSVLLLSQCRLDKMFLSSPHLNSSTHSNIQHLDLSMNRIDSISSSVLTNMSSLRVLDLSWNILYSSVPIMPSLLELDLSANSFKQIEHLGIWRWCHLKQLSASFNHFEIEMIESLMNISECAQYALERLDLHGSLNGTIPEPFGRFANLRDIDLSVSELTGSIPESLGGLRFLEVLDLSDNQLTGSIPTFLGKLSKLDLSFNQLNGSIPESFEKLTALTDLNLESNQLTGSIPRFCGKLVKLALSFNKLNGSIPDSFGKLTFLTQMNLAFNQLTGPIPTFPVKLSKIDISFNQLNGSIPESLGKLTALTDLNMKFNRLTGPIPTSIGRLLSLQFISLSSNFLNGTIPVSVGQLAKLNFLDISNNCLEGVVFEAHFSNLSMLKHLDTSFNTKLTFNVSHEWIPPFRLIYLNLSSCNIANGFPQWLRNQRNLNWLVLSNATISGPLPTWLRRMPIISFLDLSHNKLNGPLKNLPNGGDFNELGYDGPLKALYMEYNLFNESIPRSLCRWTYLQLLDLSGNRLSGKIPKCLGNLKNLYFMRFSSNELSGVIPGSIALISSSLMWLGLNNNNFIGELPRELGKLRELRVLDLGDNKLSGYIPECIGEFRFLMVLRLHNNNFTGRISSSLCRNSNLQILDVAQNNLMGTIPHCFRQLNAMVSSMQPPDNELRYDEKVIQVMKGVDLEYGRSWTIVFNMDLSSNKLVGEIPLELTALSMLMGLNLSNNHLSGRIPESIGNMRKLESLDFSNNKLIGMIPPSMAALNFLSHLNLSHNNLLGPIPTGNQLQTFMDPSIYAGNKDLCGAPLPNNCSNHEDSMTTIKKIYEEGDERMKVWFYADIMSGFVTGFWGIIGVLLLKKQWRRKLFMFAEETIEKIYVAVVVRVSTIKRRREAA